MKKKMGTVMDDRLLDRARGLAQREHVTLADLFATALTEYIARHAPPSVLPSSVAASYGGIPLSSRRVLSLEQDDPFDVE
jgi:hypothetical protein